MAERALPQLDRLFLTDGGLETDMIFGRGVELPCFAAITLLRDDQGKAVLKEYYRPYLELAKRAETGFVLESASWRASPDWADPLGMDLAELDDLNRESIRLLHDLRGEYSATGMPIIVSGCIGPRGDGYDPGRIMSLSEAEDYHRRQAVVLASEAPDMICAMTINNVKEAIGVTRAVATTGLPFALSFTVETDGLLPTGDTLADAVEAVDDATGGYPSYYMINCAHPTHFDPILEGHGDWLKRIKGIRANASACSHAELDGMTELDSGDPDDLGTRYRRLREIHPQINVLGGCCGTDIRHLEAITRACTGGLEVAA